MLKINNLHKSIENTPILKGINMHIPEGSIYGLVGTNGSGKTTLLRTISGGYRYESGEITLNGGNIFENPGVKARVAYVPDEVFFGVADSMKSLMILYQNMYSNFDRDLYKRLLSEFDSLNEKKLMRTFSKGMQRQAAIILAICTRPGLLLLDEPMDGLDPIIRRKILRIILEYVGLQKMSVLVSSHNLRELEDICDRVGIMKEGQIVLEQSLENLESNVIKVQIAMDDHDLDLPEGVSLLHKQSIGKVHTLILKGETEKALTYFRELEPVIMDVIPMTLEEIFIYELGGGDFESK